MNEAPVHSNGRSRTYWTPTMERYFTDLMLDQLNRGNRAGHTFNKQAWGDMLVVFNEKFGSQYDKDVLKGRYSTLWKQFNVVKILLGQSGFSWDETRHMVVADDYVWDAYVKANPEVRSYRTKSFPNFNDLCLIYEYTTADGRYSRSSHDVDFDDDVQGEGFYGQVPSSMERLKTEWTTAMDKYFIELLLDQVGGGSKSGDTFTKQAWDDMLASFNAKFGSNHGKRVLRHRYKKLSKYYNDTRKILKRDGFSWDETRQMITADDDAWDAYIKAYPHARAYRKKTLPNYRDLALIYENSCDCANQGQSSQPEELKNEEPKVKAGEGKFKQKHANGDRTRTFWTLPMERQLVDLLMDQVLKGNKLGQTFISQAWTEITTSFNTVFTSKYEKDVLKNHYKHLRKQFNGIKNVLKQDGFSWDESREMLAAEDGVWDAYIKECPSARAYRFKTVPSFHKLCFVFGEEILSGQYSRLTLNIDSESELPMLITGENGSVRYSSSIDSSAVEWTEEMDQNLIGQILELVQGGSGTGQILDDSKWSHIISRFNDMYGIQFDKSVLQKRLDLLMKRHDEISSLLSQGGFSWDELQQTVTADDHVWEVYTKDHPEAIVYRNKCFGNYNCLHKIRALGGLLMRKLDEQGSDSLGGTYDAQDFERDGASVNGQLSLIRSRETPQERKRPGSDSTAETTSKMPRTEIPAEDSDVTSISAIRKERRSYTVEGAIRALQEITDIDDDLLLDACDLLEDEKKAKIFSALDAPLRKKWLLRKLRPLL